VNPHRSTSAVSSGQIASDRTQLLPLSPGAFQVPEYVFNALHQEKQDGTHDNSSERHPKSWNDQKIECCSFH
jgi:hypothetical protein